MKNNYLILLAYFICTAMLLSSCADGGIFGRRDDNMHNASVAKRLQDKCVWSGNCLPGGVIKSQNSEENSQEVQ